VISKSLLPALPPQPEGVRFPDPDWSAGEPLREVQRDRLDAVVSRVMDAPFVYETGSTHAIVVIHRGRLVLERYGDEQTADTTLISWSMAKSVLHALTGFLVREGKLDIAQQANVPAWQQAGDPRRDITFEHLLRMVDGLDFIEEYVEGAGSHVIDMLFDSGKEDVAAYAEQRPLAHRPGCVWNYSSGTSNILSGCLGRVVGGGRAEMESLIRRELFVRIGMMSATARFDAAGTFIASSFVYATARDFARFGLLYLRDGVWDGVRILPEGWVDHARTPTPPSDGRYGAHWWLATDGSGIFTANGYRGQHIIIDPRRDLVVVRLGSSSPRQRTFVLRFLAELVDCFPNLRKEDGKKDQSQQKQKR
jgi:CubicO group peptidase (beta-lactamase class C family)